MTSGALERLWVGLGTHLWQTSLVLVALFVVARAMRRAPAGFINSLLWIGLAKLFVPLPLLKILVGGAVDSAIGMASSAGVAMKATLPLVERTAAVLDPTGAFLGTGRHLGDGLPAALTVVWAAGALVVAGAWLLSARPPRLAGAVPASEAPTAQRRLLVGALRGTGVPESVVLVTRSRVVPYVTGLVRPRIVVPFELIDRVGDTGLRSILLHENAHRTRREPLRLLLSRIAAVTFFFYPFLWPLLRRLRETAEMACDDAVLAGGVRPEAYASALASVLDMGLAAAPSSAAIDRRSPSLMRRRLTRLDEPGRCTMKVGHRAVLSLAVICVLLSSLLSLSSSAGGPATDSRAPDPVEKPAPAAEPAPVPLPEKFDIHLSKMVPPEYPEVAREKGLEAIVFMQLTLAPDLTVTAVTEKTTLVGYPPLEVIKVGKDGKVVEPVEEEGMAAYHEVFIKAATEAALQWQLEVRPEGASVEATEVVVPIRFRLDGDKDKSEVESD